MGKHQRNTEKLSQMKSDQAERLRALEAENERLKGEVAILKVDKLILGEVAEENNRRGS